MKKILVLSSMVAVMMAANAQASLVVFGGWEMNGLSGYGPSPFAATSKDANITNASLARGSGVGTSGSAAGNAWGGNGWDTSSLGNAIAAGNFATITFAPVTGQMMSFDNISAYNIRRSSTGPTSGQWQFQIGTGSFTNIGSEITWGSTTTAAGNLQSGITLSTISSLQNVQSAVTFRLVNWGTTSDSGTWYFNNFTTGNTSTNGHDLVFSGTIAAVPEPSALLLVGSVLGFGFLRRRRA